MQELLDVPAPAKLNLFLHVTGRRLDGYHLLQSLFVLVDWCDRLTFQWRKDGGISREDLNGHSLPAEDLCVRAARALQRATGCTQGAHIRLEKHLPAEAGMGGGSSDAATCLLTLNRLWGLGLNRKELSEIALPLGADVPFFVGGRTAWVEGIGETLTPIELEPARFIVIKPLDGASTQDIFRSSELKRDTETAILQGFAANGQEGTNRLDLRKVLEWGHNDLQPVAKALCPGIGACLDWLSSHGLHGRMTGSGSAVFALIEPGMTLPEMPAGWTSKICSILNVHPLHDWCPD
ncbi:MAG: 4-(cytidine 5'-diphospho)-2-C-methyl-D-erythritol kinase [Hydrogenophaga sp.]